MELWFTENYIVGSGINIKIKKTLYSKKNKYQEVGVFETEDFGNLLVIDGMVMLTEKDEFVYHDMISHIPVFVHPKPHRVLVIGGGDGGTVRELVKHQDVKSITMVEIDGDVVDASKKFLPTLSSQLNNRRVQLIIGDGIQYVKKHKNKFDIIILDSSDPVGPAQGLFSTKFFKDVYDCLAKDGILVAQTESPFIYEKVIRETYKILKGIFPITNMYLASIPMYPSGLWSFAFCSKKYHPIKDFDSSRFEKSGIKTKYYNSGVHLGSFLLPNFVKEMVK